LDQIEESLNQQIAIAMHWRQRRIVFGDEADMLREPVLRQEPRAIEHFMDVDGTALDRATVGEYFHPVDQRADTVGFVADEMRQLAVGRRRVFLKQLRRAADAGERVL